MVVDEQQPDRPVVSRHRAPPASTRVPAPGAVSIVQRAAERLGPLPHRGQPEPARRPAASPAGRSRCRRRRRPAGPAPPVSSDTSIARAAACRSALASASLATRSTSRSTVRSCSRAGPRVRSDSRHVVHPAEQLDPLAQRAGQPVGVDVDRPQRVDQRAHLGQPGPGQLAHLVELVGQPRVGGPASAAALSAARVRLNSVWVTESCSSRASRARSSATDSSRARSVRCAFTTASAACTASVSISAWSASVNSPPSVFRPGTARPAPRRRPRSARRGTQRMSGCAARPAEEPRVGADVGQPDRLGRGTAARRAGRGCAAAAPIRAHVSASHAGGEEQAEAAGAVRDAEAAYRAPARSRAASRMTRSTGSVRRSAPSASATSSRRRSATASVLPTPAILRRSGQRFVGGPFYGAEVEVALGFRPHSGWAVGVVVGLGPVVLGRHRLELPGPTQPYHDAVGLPLAEAEELVAQATTAAYERAAAALAELAAGHQVVGAAIVAGAGTVREDVPLARVLAAHAMLHAAEGELYRDALADAADALGLPVTLIRRGTRRRSAGACSAATTRTCAAGSPSWAGRSARRGLATTRTRSSPRSRCWSPDAAAAPAAAPSAPGPGRRPAGRRPICTSARSVKPRSRPARRPGPAPAALPARTSSSPTGMTRGSSPSGMPRSGRPAQRRRSFSRARQVCAGVDLVAG